MLATFNQTFFLIFEFFSINFGWLYVRKRYGIEQLPNITAAAWLTVGELSISYYNHSLAKTSIFPQCVHLHFSNS